MAFKPRNTSVCGTLKFPEADKSYKRFIAALLENPALPLRIGKESNDVLVSELADAFLEAHETRMNKGASKSSCAIGKHR